MAAWLRGSAAGRAALAAFTLAGCDAADAMPPAPGRYTAQLCVGALDAAPSCGPVELEWRSAARARLRISDMVYTLRLRTSQVEVALQHGAMQIDEFTAVYEWQGDALRFVDADKSVRYELRRTAPQPAH